MTSEEWPARGVRELKTGLSGVNWECSMPSSERLWADDDHIYYIILKILFIGNN